MHSNSGDAADSTDQRHPNTEKSPNSKAGHRRGSHSSSSNAFGRASPSPADPMSDLHADTAATSAGVPTNNMRGISASPAFSIGVSGGGNSSGNSGAGREDDDDRTSIVSLDSDSTNGPLFWFVLLRVRGRTR